MLNQLIIISALQIIIISKILYKGLSVESNQDQALLYVVISLCLFFMSLFIYFFLEIKKQVLTYHQTIKLCLFICTLQSLSIWFASVFSVEYILQFQVIFQIQLFTNEYKNAYIGQCTILLSMALFSFNIQNFINQESSLFFFDMPLILLDIVQLALNMKNFKPYTLSDLSSRQEITNFPTQVKANVQFTNHQDCNIPSAMRTSHQINYQQRNFERALLLTFLNEQQYLLVKNDLNVIEHCIDRNKLLTYNTDDEEIIDLILNITIQHKQTTINLKELIKKISNEQIVNSSEIYNIQPNPVLDFQNVLLNVFYISGSQEFILQFIWYQDQLNQLEMKKTAHENEIVNIFKSLSHELGTNLNSILTFSNMAFQDDQISNDIKSQYIEPIVINSEQLNLILSNIRDFNLFYLNSFILKLDEIDVLEEVGFVENLFKDAMQNKNIELVHKFLMKADKLVTDKQRFRQVLFQILQNAIKFTQMGHVEIRVENDESLCKISVTDTGIGLTQFEANRLNHLLNTTNFIKISSHSVGSGLGLKISNQIVKQMNIQNQPIKFQSIYSQGATFSYLISNNQFSKQSSKQSKELRSCRSIIHFVSHNSYVESQKQLSRNKSYLPYPSSVNQLDQKESSSSDLEFISQFQREEDAVQINLPPYLKPNLQDSILKCSLKRLCCSKILIVDDEYFNIRCLKLLMKKVHNKCDHAYNGQEAIEMILKKKENPCSLCQNAFYSLLFLDVNMPIMDGVETVKEVKQMINEGIIPKVYCVANTGFSDLDTKLQCYDAGMDFVITKPIDAKSLNLIINKLYHT